MNFDFIFFFDFIILLISSYMSRKILNPLLKTRYFKTKSGLFSSAIKLQEQKLLHYFYPPLFKDSLNKLRDIQKILCEHEFTQYKDNHIMYNYGHHKIRISVDGEFTYYIGDTKYLNEHIVTKIEYLYI